MAKIFETLEERLYDLADIYLDNMEGADLTEFVFWDKMFCSARLLADAMKAERLGKLTEYVEKHGAEPQGGER